MDKIVVANGIILNDKHEILVAKDAKAFGLPGGTIKPGETDVEALARELEEELGVKLEKTTLVKYYDYPKALQENVPLQMRVYLVEIEGVPKAQDDITELVWLNKENYSQRDDFPKLWWDVIFHDLQDMGVVNLF